jgi:hypothetical protein
MREINIREKVIKRENDSKKNNRREVLKKT